MVTCDQGVQPLGYLLWAACGKDPGFSPASLLQNIRQTSRYSQAELDLLDFAGPLPDAVRLASRWHAMLREAQAVCDDTLPAETAGRCVRLGSEELCTASSRDLPAFLQTGRLRFHAGTIGGAWPHYPLDTSCGRRAARARHAIRLGHLFHGEPVRAVAEDAGEAVEDAIAGAPARDPRLRPPLGDGTRPAGKTPCSAPRRIHIKYLDNRC